MRQADTLLAYGICLKSPKQTSYGKMGKLSFSKTSLVLIIYFLNTTYFLLMALAIFLS